MILGHQTDSQTYNHYERTSLPRIGFVRQMCAGLLEDLEQPELLKESGGR